MMHDTHCHLDLYPDPYAVAIDIEKANITTVAVTNLPSAYFAAKPHIEQFRSLNLAVGLHPLLALEHTSREKQLFQIAVQETIFVGEVGLDFSRDGVDTRDEQIKSFRFVLEQLQGLNRFVTIHSRKAEDTILGLLNEYEVCPEVFHWYSGTLDTLISLVDSGHYLSINTSMLRTNNGKRIIEHIPRGRVLTETDGPFTQIGRKPTVPADVKVIHKYLSSIWDDKPPRVEQQLNTNLVNYLRAATK